MNYAWSLYKFIEGKMELIDILRFDLSGYYASYIEQLKTFSIQYSKILQFKSNKRELMARGWMSMKAHLKNWRIRETIKNTLGTITLDCYIEIQGDLDHLTIEEIEKIKALRKDEAKTAEKVHIDEAKTLSSLQIDPKDQIDDLELKIRPKGSVITPQQSHQPQGIMEFALNIPSKNWGVLSDIIQASNQQSHQNHGDRTDRSDRKPSEAGLNSQMNPVKNFYKTKTFHFVPDQQPESSDFRRNNSLQTRLGSRLDVDPQQDIKQRSQEEEIEQIEEKIEEFTNQSTIIKAQLRLQSKINPPNAAKLRYWLIIFLIFTIFAGTSLILSFTLKDKINIRKQFLKRNEKLKKNNISWKL